MHKKIKVKREFFGNCASKRFKKKSFETCASKRFKKKSFETCASIRFKKKSFETCASKRFIKKSFENYVSNRYNQKSKQSTTHKEILIQKEILQNLSKLFFEICVIKRFNPMKLMQSDLTRKCFVLKEIFVARYHKKKNMKILKQVLHNQISHNTALSFPQKMCCAIFLIIDHCTVRERDRLAVACLKSKQTKHDRSGAAADCEK